MTSVGSIELIDTASVDEFLDAVFTCADDISTSEYRSRWVFRGQLNASWELKPTAWRSDGQEKLNPLLEWIGPQVLHAIHHVPSWGSLTDQHRKHREIIAIQEAAEFYAVRLFCENADDLGIFVPYGINLPNLEDIIAQSCNHAGGSPHNWLSMYEVAPFAFAQHHGIPTRCLDWTRDPLAACLFAAEKFREMTDAEVGSHLCVWAITPDTNFPSTLRWLKIPRGQHAYFHAQSGLFSHFIEANAFFLDEGKWPDIRDILGQDRFHTKNIKLRQIRLPHSQRKQLLQRLRVRGVSRSHLMPSLDNVGVDTCRRWHWLPTTKTP